MSTASVVPETADRHGDRPWTTLVEAERRRLLVAAFFTCGWLTAHPCARLALMTALVAVQGLIAVTPARRRWVTPAQPEPASLPGAGLPSLEK